MSTEFESAGLTLAELNGVVFRLRGADIVRQLIAGDSRVRIAAADATAGQLNAIVKMMKAQAGEDALERFLQGALVVSEPVRRWRVDENGWIRFSLASTGETGIEWADWFRANGYDLGNETEFMLRSGTFQPSPKGTVYKIAVLPGKLWKDADRITSKVRAYCNDHSLKHGKEENPEVGCLIRRAFSDEEIEAMGLTWIVTLHEPISGSDGYPDLFGAYRCYGLRRFYAYDGEPGHRWHAVYGFAVLVSQVSPSASES